MSAVAGGVGGITSVLSFPRELTLGMGVRGEVNSIKSTHARALPAFRGGEGLVS